MEADALMALGATTLMLGAGSFLFWRYYWFFRNPPRNIPTDEAILSPADGTVVYVKQVPPHEEIVVIKRGVRACINDIVRGDLASPKILIGIFMSPFNVHYNRSPLPGRVEFIRHHPAVKPNCHMGSMHLRTLLRHPPFFKNCLHIINNERTVTKIKGSFKGEEVSCYIIQIAARSVNGIDSYFEKGAQVEKGEIFGMIRIGSQVDLVITPMPGMRIKVKEGDKVRAGESILID